MKNLRNWHLHLISHPKFKGKTNILCEGRLYNICDRDFTIYDFKTFNKLYQIQFDEAFKILSVIQLDNGDLVFATRIETYNIYEILIYRLMDNLNNRKYFLLQKINEDRRGYELQNDYSGCMAFPKKYEVKDIKAISGNRFILENNYGFKIYSLNEKNEYSLILIEIQSKGEKIIQEINYNNFIFWTRINCGMSLGGPAYDKILIELI